MGIFWVIYRRGCNLIVSIDRWWSIRNNYSTAEALLLWWYQHSTAHYFTPQRYWTFGKSTFGVFPYLGTKLFSGTVHICVISILKIVQFFNQRLFPVGWPPPIVAVCLFLLSNSLNCEHRLKVNSNWITFALTANILITSSLSIPIVGHWNWIICRLCIDILMILVCWLFKKICYGRQGNECISFMKIPPQTIIIITSV